MERLDDFVRIIESTRPLQPAIIVEAFGGRLWKHIYGETEGLPVPCAIVVTHVCYEGGLHRLSFYGEVFARAM